MEEYILEAMKFFTVDEWTKFDGSEQLNYGRVLYIYYACTHLDIPVVLPNFMNKQKPEETKLHVPYQRGLYTCKYCLISFDLRKYKAMHLKTCLKRLEFFKQKKKKYTCEKCNYETSHLEHLRRHNMTHTKQKEYFCDFCQKKFLSKFDLKVHKNNDHRKEEKEYRCDKCPYKTNRKDGFVRHLKVHSDIKSFICDICKKGFNYRQQLKHHLFTHNNQEKPFKCLHCEKGFVTAQMLTRHVNAVHFKLKQFKCDQCEYSSAIKNNLKTHSYTHLNDKPYKCTICDYQSCQNALLKEHLKNKHGKHLV